MKAKLIVDGNEFDIEILDTKLQELLVPKKKTGYERVEQGREFIFQHVDGSVCTGYDHHNKKCNDYFDAANYYSSSVVAENNARADKLMRQLRRFAVEHKNGELDYDCGVYTIHWDGKKITTIRQYGRDFGHILFDSGKTCNLAIETFHDELIWYFTEYKNSL